MYPATSADAEAVQRSSMAPSPGNALRLVGAAGANRSTGVTHQGRDGDPTATTPAPVSALRTPKHRSRPNSIGTVNSGPEIGAGVARLGLAPVESVSSMTNRSVSA